MSVSSELCRSGLLLTVASLAVAVAAGGLLYCFLLRESALVAFGRGLGVSFALGSGLVAWSMMVLLLAGMHLTLGGVLGIVGFCLVMAWAAGRVLPNSGRTPHDNGSRPVPLWRRALALLLALVLARQFALLLMMTVLVDISHYDALHIWGPRAIGIFLNQSFFEWPATRHGEQPQLVPLMFAWTFMWHGQVADQYIKIVSASFVFAATLALYWGLRRRGVAPDWAMAWCCFGVLVGSWWFSGGCQAYADVPLSLFVIVSVILADEWAWTGSWRSLALAGIAAGMAALTKLEGNVAWVVILGMACLGGRMAKGQSRPGWRLSVIAAGLVFALWVLIAGPWYVAEAAWGSDSYATQVQFAHLPQLGRLGVVVYEAGLVISPLIRGGTKDIAGSAFTPTGFGVLFVWLAILLLIVPDAVRRTRTHLVALAILAWMAIALCPYMTTMYPVRLGIRQAFNRQMMQIQPVAVFFLGVFLHRWLGPGGSSGDAERAKREAQGAAGA